MITTHRSIALLFAAALIATGPAVRASPPPDIDAAFYPQLRQALARDYGFHDGFDAQVWLQDMSTRLAPRLPVAAQRVDLLEIVHQEASRVALAPELVLSVIDVESAFHRFAISPSGARGYMQIMPFWLNQIGRPADDLFDTRINIRLGCMILRYYLDRTGGDMVDALTDYNGGGDPIYAQRVLRALSHRWFKQ